MTTHPVAAVVLLAVTASTALADPITASSTIASGTWSVNGHQYAVVAAPFLTWDQANQAAAARPGNWHLATVTSPGEQAFIESLGLPGNEFWLGGFQNPLSTLEREANWTWITGEAFSYTNWATVLFIEPNDYFGPGSEQYLGMVGAETALSTPQTTGRWNDEAFIPNLSGYVVESPTPVPEPATLPLILTGLASLRLAVRGWRARAGESRAAGGSGPGA